MKTKGGPRSPGDDIDGYPPIEDYAIIGDCRTAALVSGSGSIDWLCLPHFSGRAVFAALLDRQRGGRFAIRPTAPFRVTRAYEPGTNVLCTTFATDGGTVRLTDLMPILTGPDWEARIQPQREILRVVEGLEGAVEVEIIFNPRPDYARAPPAVRPRGRLGWACQYRDELFTLLTDMSTDQPSAGQPVRGTTTLRAGETRYASLAYTCHDAGVLALLDGEAEARKDATVRWWRGWADRSTYNGPYREAVQRSALTLKLLTFFLSGAVVAAPTTSLPEMIGSVRNWDYRFCWLRDASLTLRSFIDLGYREEGEAFFDWLVHSTRLTRPELQVLYDVYGETRLTEKILDHLEGYRGSRPVRIGNAAHDQLQLDIYGAVVFAAFDFVERGGRLDSEEQRILVGLGDAVCRLWRQPDQGIWELRDEPRHTTYSKLMCWVTLDRLLRLHEDGYLRVAADRLRAERDAIHKEVDAHAFDPELGCYVSAFGQRSLDASLLLMPRYGYLSPSDPRMIATYDRIWQELGSNGLLRRYGGGYDSMPPGEGAFGICNFWAVDYLARRGDVAEAERLFEHLLSFANDLGLYAEEIDTETGAALGNFPQAFTHVGLIAAALSLDEARQRIKGQRNGNV